MLNPHFWVISKELSGGMVQTPEESLGSWRGQMFTHFPLLVMGIYGGEPGLVRRPKEKHSEHIVIWHL